MNKKIKAVINENLLFSFRENLLIVPIWTYIIFMLVYLLFWDNAILSNFKEISYISIMSNIQYILWVLIIIFLSITSFDKDFKTKNIYIILQQVNKKDYFIWKLISIILISWLLNLFLMLIFYIWYIIEFKELNISLIYIFLFQQLEFFIIALISSVISLALSKNVWRMILIIIIILLWHTIPLLKQLVDWGIMHLSKIWHILTDVVYYTLPNLALLNVKDIILYNSSLGLTFWIALWYTLWISYILYIIAIYIFNKKDF